MSRRRGASAGVGDGLRGDTARVTRPRRWQPQWAVLGAFLVVGGVFAFVAVSASFDERTAVVVAATSLRPGETIAAEDLRAEEIALSGSAVDAIPAARAVDLVGMVTTGPVEQGELLSAGDVTSRRALKPGLAVVGAVLAPGAAPVSTLHVGEVVNVVAAPPEGTDAAQAAVLTAATVYDVDAVGDTPAGGWVVSLAVPEDAQAAVVAAAARDRLRLTLVSSDDPAAASPDTPASGGEMNEDGGQ
jgi:SAF domain